MSTSTCDKHGTWDTVMYPKCPCCEIIDNGDTPCSGCNGKGYMVMGEHSSYEYENYYDVCGEVVRKCPLCLGRRVIPEMKERT